MSAPIVGGLVLLRHGQSEWNARNVFTGWANPELTANGEREAARAGKVLAAQVLRPGFAHTSLQRRAIRSAELDVTARLLPYWYDSIVPDLGTGSCVLVVSHGNTLRALVKHLDSTRSVMVAVRDQPVTHMRFITTPLTFASAAKLPNARRQYWPLPASVPHPQPGSEEPASPSAHHHRLSRMPARAAERSQPAAWPTG